MKARAKRLRGAPANPPRVSDCNGCRDDFYNHDGHGLDGVCWNLKSATWTEIKLVSNSQPPPWNRVPTETRPSCYRPSGYTRIDPASLDSRGYQNLFR